MSKNPTPADTAVSRLDAKGPLRACGTTSFLWWVSRCGDDAAVAYFWIVKTMAFVRSVAAAWA